MNPRFAWKQVSELSMVDFNGNYTPRAAGQQPVFVLYYRRGCPYCKAIKNDWERVAQAVAPAGVAVCAVSLDLNPALKSGFSTVPTMILYGARGASALLYPQAGARDWQSICVWLCTKLGRSTNPAGFCL